MGESVLLNLQVKNTGKLDGDEVVQVYIRNLQDPAGPLKSLRAYERISVKAGETQTVELILAPSAFEFFNPSTEKMEVLSGEYEILYGGSSDDNNLKSMPLKIHL